jgi:hypothetical protein
MTIISFSRLREFYESHPTAKPGFLGWYKIARKSNWQTFEQLHQAFSSADQVLIAEQNLRQKDLVPIFKTESIVSDMLHHWRKLTVEHIQKLADFFHVSPAVFFPN